MLDTDLTIADPTRSSPDSAMNARSWFHTIALGVVFVLLAILADVVGAHDETAVVVRSVVVRPGSPSTTTRSAPRDAAMRGPKVSAVTRPTTPG